MGGVDNGCGLWTTGEGGAFFVLLVQVGVILVGTPAAGGGGLM